MYAMQLRCRRPWTRTVQARGKVPSPVRSTGRWKPARKTPEGHRPRGLAQVQPTRRFDEDDHEREGGGDRAREGDGDRADGAHLRHHRGSAARRVRAGDVRFKNVEPTLKAKLKAVSRLRPRVVGLRKWASLGRASLGACGLEEPWSCEPFVIAPPRRNATTADRLALRDDRPIVPRRR